MHLVPIPHEDTALSSWHTKGENTIADTSGACKLKTQKLVVTETEIHKKLNWNARTCRGKMILSCQLQANQELFLSWAKKCREQSSNTFFVYKH